MSIIQAARRITAKLAPRFVPEEAAPRPGLSLSEESFDRLAARHRGDGAAAERLQGRRRVGVGGGAEGVFVDEPIGEEGAREGVARAGRIDRIDVLPGE